MAQTFDDMDAAVTALTLTYVDAAGFPALTDDQVAAVLAQCQETDAAGLNPGDDGYVPTINMAVAASRAWQVKAMLCATAYDMNTDGQTLNRSQAAAACERMARTWMNRVVW